MSFFDWVLKILMENWPVLLRGTGVTLLISITGTIVGFAIGLISGIVRTIPITEKTSLAMKVFLKIINALISIYVEIFRGTPMIVQSMVIYYGVAIAFNVHLNNIFAGIFIVSINTGAYMAEIVRGGIVSIDKGQFEAAHAIGMSHWQTMKCIIMPQVIRNILPATGNEFVINIKDTSVLNVISVTELYFQTKSVAGTNFRYFETFFITCIIYFILTFTITRLLRLLERKIDGPQNYTVTNLSPEVEEAHHV